jgi:hypothetical protein
MADNIFEEIEPRKVSADDMHAVLSRLAALEEENNALKAGKSKDEPSGPNMLGGDPVIHHLHLTDGRVIANHGGIGTHYSETLEDGTERVTRIREYFPANEVHPNEKFA